MEDSVIILKKESRAVLAHVQMFQDIIKRMDDNSKQCKQWCIALQAVIVSLSKGDVSLYMLACAIVVSLLFLSQDAGYLAFSRHYRLQQQMFIEKLNNIDDYGKDIFCVNKLEGCERCRTFLKAAISIFVWPIYIAFIVFMIFLYLNN